MTISKNPGAGGAARGANNHAAKHNLNSPAPASCPGAEVLAAALAYAARGIPVFPCGKDKKPFKGSHGFKDATTDRGQIERWWHNHPEALIAMPTGRASGYDVLDLDNKVDKNGFNYVPGWEHATPTIATTQSGGAHLYFKADGLTCSAGKVAPGVDTRGDGGYVILPPSPGYQWLKGGIPATDLPAMPHGCRPGCDHGNGISTSTDNVVNFPAPDWLLEKVKGHEGKGVSTAAEDLPRKATVEEIVAALAIIPANCSEDEWWRIGAALYDHFGGSEEGFDLFHTWSATGGTSYKGERDCRNKWRHSASKEKIHVGTLFHIASQYDERWRDGVEEQGSVTEEQSTAEGPPTKEKGPPTTDRLNEWDAGDDTEPIPPRGWLLANIFCRGFASSLIADGGTGKSALRYAQGISLASGRPLTGEHVFQRCRVLIVSFEDGRDELRRRVKAAMQHHRVSRDEVKGWLFLAAVSRDAGKLLTVDLKGRAVVGSLADNLRAVIRRLHIDLIILDPFVKTHGVEENDNNRMDQVIQILAELAIEEDIAVDFPHHTSKGRAATPGDADRGRGATAVKDGARLVYTLTTMTTGEAERFGVDEGERRLHFRVDSGKVNIAPPSRDAAWFKLVGVPLGNSNELYPNGDNVQTVEQWSPPAAFEGLTDDLIKRILDEIAGGLPDGTFFGGAPNAKETAAWRAVQRHAPDKNEAQCREVIKAWIRDEVLVTFDYKNPNTRRDVKGLKVDDAKRPDVM